MASVQQSDIGRALKRLSKSLRPGHGFYTHSAPGRLETQRPFDGIWRGAQPDQPQQLPASRHDTAPNSSHTNIETSAAEDSLKAAHKYFAKKLIGAVIESVTGLEEVIKGLRNKRQRPVDCPEPRVEHVRKILAIEDRRLSAAVGGHDRIKFICACLSLAKDFELYRRQRLDQPKTEKSSECLPMNADYSISDDELYDAFVATQAPVNGTEKRVLNAAVRFGTKLRIVDAIGRSLDLGPGFALLCAYDYFNLSALPHRAFPVLRQELDQSWAVCNGIKSFSSTIQNWWQRYLDSYEQQLSSISLDHRIANANEERTHPQIHSTQSPNESRKDSSDTSTSIPRLTRRERNYKPRRSRTADGLANLNYFSRQIASCESPDASREHSLADQGLGADRSISRPRTAQRPTNEALKRRSRSVDSLAKVARDPVFLLEEKQMPETPPEVPRRSSRRPTVDCVAASSRYKGHQKSRSVDRTQFERPRPAPSPPRDSGRKQSASRYRGHQHSRSVDRPAFDKPRRVPSPPTIQLRPKTSSLARKPLPPPKSKFIEKTAETARKPPMEFEPAELTRKLNEIKMASLEEAEHIVAQCAEAPAEAYWAANKPTRNSERPSPTSVEIHLNDLLQGLEEQLSADCAALPSVQCSA